MSVTVIEDFRKCEEDFGLTEYPKMRPDNMCGKEQRPWLGGDGNWE